MMKLFLSDLHLGDGKERDDFQYHREFDELVVSLSEEFPRIEMVLLGDIFDLIRTKKYYELEEEPFTEDKLRAVKRIVMAEILENHTPFFETLRHFVEQPDRQFRYVAGNHDFGTMVDNHLLGLIQERYGLDFTPEHYYHDEYLGIWAEHGHRYDIVNSTFAEDGGPISYCLGDQVVIEIVNKFVDKVKEREGELGIDPEIINDLDNVRPQTAIPKWLNSIDEEGGLSQIFWETVLTFGASHPGEVGALVLDLIQGNYQPDLLKAARALVKKGFGKYILFGHTHNPIEKDLRRGAKYLNTGTWRKFIEPKGRPSFVPKIVPTYSEGGTQFFGEEVFYRCKFTSIINLSYILFYEEGEGEVGPQLIFQEKEV